MRNIKGDEGGGDKNEYDDDNSDDNDNGSKHDKSE